MAYNSYEEMFKNLPSWREVRRYLPLTIGAVAVLFVIIAVSTSVYTVETEGEAVVKRLGKAVRIEQYGLHFKLPFGIERAHFVPTKRVLKEEFGYRTKQAAQRTRYGSDNKTKREALMLTGDLNVVSVKWVVQYTIANPDRYLHQVRQQTKSIRDVSEAVMRRIVGNRISRDVLTTARAEIANTVLDEMQNILDKYKMGVQLKTVKMADVAPPVERVKVAFNEVNQAKQQKETLINEAKKKRNQQIPKARGEAKQMVNEAQGYKAERVNVAKGEAARFEELLEEYRAAPNVTRRRLYLETMDKVLREVETLYVTGEGTSSPLPLLNLKKGIKRSINQQQ